MLKVTVRCGFRAEEDKRNSSTFLAEKQAGGHFLKAACHSHLHASKKKLAASFKSLV